jgi:hypothetical protein
MATSARRLLLVGTALLSGGCFALFSLDDYGPPSEAPTSADAAGVDVVTPASDGGDGGAGRLGRIVFVTSADFDVSDGGVQHATGAHALCNAIAAKAKLPGTYLAWISDERNNANPSRVPAGLDVQGDTDPLVTPTGQLIASGIAELLDAGPRIPISITENGVEVPAFEFPDGGATENRVCPDAGLVWSGLRGQASDTPSACVDWTTNDGLQTGGAGVVSRSRTSWVYACDLPCSLRARLYCIQQ